MHAHPTDMEIQVIQRMMRSEQVTPVPTPGRIRSGLQVARRDWSPVGYIVHFEQHPRSRFLQSGDTLRWGQVTGRLDGTLDVDFVVYVDDGYVTALECVTFGGEPMPEEYGEFELFDITT